MVKLLNNLFKNKNIPHVQNEDIEDWEQINRLIWLTVFDDYPTKINSNNNNNISNISNESDDLESTKNDDCNICYKEFKNKLLKPLEEMSVLNDSMHSDSILSSPSRHCSSRVNSIFSTPKKETKIYNDEKRLHVTNIPFDFKETDLRQLFEKYGVIKDIEIIRNERGSMGFGFLTFVHGSDADKAREALNGQIFPRYRKNKVMNLELKVNIAYEKKSRNNTQNEAANTTCSQIFDNNNNVESDNSDSDSTNENCC